MCPETANGLEATRRLLRATRGALRVVILSNRSDDASVLHALQDGATGFVLKSAGPTELEIAVRAAARGHSFLCPSIARPIIDEYLLHIDGREDGQRRLPPRQREVLRLVAAGNTTREIAHRLDITIKTVESHRSEIMRRLGVHNVAGLVQQAIGMGLLGR